MVSRVAAAMFQFRCKAHHVERFGCRVGRMQPFARQAIFDGPDQSGDKSSLAQNRVHQVRCGGLAVGSRDAREQNPLVRMLIEVAARRWPARGGRAPLRSKGRRNPAGFGNSLTTAHAPRPSASWANLRPSTRDPANAKNKKSFSTRRESYSSPATVIAATAGESSLRSFTPSSTWPRFIFYGGTVSPTGRTRRSPNPPAPSFCKLDFHSPAGRKNGSRRRILAPHHADFRRSQCLHL